MVQAEEAEKQEKAEHKNMPIGRRRLAHYSALLHLVLWAVDLHARMVEPQLIVDEVLIVRHEMVDVEAYHLGEGIARHTVWRRNPP